MLTYRSYKFRLYPNKEQEALILKTFGCARFVFNQLLDEWNKTYDATGEGLSYFTCTKRLPSLKKEYEWLRDVDSTALAHSARHLADAYTRFYKKQTGRPRFKSKRQVTQTYSTTLQNVAQRPDFSIKGNQVKLPRLKWIRFANSRQVKGRIIQATIRRNANGKYFVSLHVEQDIEALPKTGSSIGVDVGLKTFAVLSDGSKYQTNRHFKSLEKRMLRESRKLSRRHAQAVLSKTPLREAKNYQKQRIKVARLYERVKNKRMDFLHKVSTEIVKNHDVIGIETLRISTMAKQSYLRRAFNDAAWSTFHTMLEYKAAWYGKHVVRVSRTYPSSQLCSSCGFKHKLVKQRALREWICPNCGTHHDRDINAGLNLKQEAERILASSTVGVTGLA